MSKYTFTGLVTDRQTLHVFRIHLRDEPTVQEIRHLFYDLYAQTRFDVNTLLLEKEDHHFLSDDFRKNYTRDFSYQMAKGFRENFFCDGRISCLHVPNAGGTVHIASLPNLDRRTVIIGFIS